MYDPIWSIGKTEALCPPYRPVYVPGDVSAYGPLFAEIGKSALSFFFSVPDWLSVTRHRSLGVTSIIPTCSSFSFWKVVCQSDRSSPRHRITRFLCLALQPPLPQGLHREAPSPSSPLCQYCFPAPPSLAEPLPRWPCSGIPSDAS